MYHLPNKKSSTTFPAWAKYFTFGLPPAIYMVIAVGLLTPVITAQEVPMGLSTRALSAPFQIENGDPMIPQKNMEILHISCFMSHTKIFQISECENK